MNTSHTNRRQALGWMGAGAALLGHPGLARAAAWQPSGNITYNISVAPGGSVDLYARGIKQALETLNLVGGHNVLPMNRPGAAGLLALQAMQKTRGDAHQLGTFHTGGIAGQVTGVLKADLRDYVPVAMMVEETTLVAVAADSPLRSATELVDKLRRDPLALKIAVAPLRGLNLHLAIAKPLKLAGVDVSQLTVVPFRSSGESVTALLGGHINVVIATGPTVTPLAQSGKVRMLASCAASRGTGPLAEVPTWRELGIAADYVSYNGVLLPPGVDAEQIRFWENALRRVAESAEWRQLVERSGNKPMFKGYVDSHRYLQSELQATQALVASLGAGAR
ncbi:MAG: tripartite tricarboxylate transporter substrate binding protein [Hydrogenophaga sp.]|uniref:Bug family tripartite tricarboxylate transporter substrate binding protein n=1 Tax=Hydrogenophaga sp. TaxID=1904254 RepID=UPI00271E1CB0|nr:tripartite tricarboxylate transporter substrate binding protein [Hydrogenophaga sp.]MDO9033197.1 tripartite tricarboxylate transporter substrate binding protein [Hydrogenophaga sp.]